MAGPSFRAAPVRVVVPATCANLGPGFDSLGLAVGLHDVVLARVTDEGLSVDVAGEGAGELRRDESHLVVKAMRATFTRLGGQPPGLELVCANRIPHGRGLGSSAAAVVAGVVAAGALVVGGLADEDALAIAAGLEGHPDNVAACLLGGATVAWTPAGAPADTGRSGRGRRWTPTPVRAERLALADELAVVAFVPRASRQRTRAARALLPVSVPHDLAARNGARVALLTHALAHRPALLLDAVADELHEPFRLAAQPAGRELVDRLRLAGEAAVLSGSGPSVVVLVIGEAGQQRAIAAAGEVPGWDTLALPVERSGAHVEA